MSAGLKSFEIVIDAIGGWFAEHFGSATPVNNRDVLLYVLIAVAVTALLARLSRTQAKAQTGTALVVQPRTVRVGEVISAFESETAALFERIAPKREHLVLHTLVMMMVLTVVLLSTIKVERVVHGPGRIASAGGQLFVAPLDRSIVREVLVKEGDTVKKGQVLATLDSTFADADLTEVSQRVASLEVEAGRLRAELDGRSYSAPAGNQYGLLQNGIYRQRQAEYAATLGEFEARISSSQASVNQYERDIVDYQKRLNLARQNEQMNLDLRRQGYVTQQQVITATDARVEVGRLLANAQGQVNSLRHTIQSVRAQKDAYIQKWRAETSAALVQAQNELDSTREKMRKAEKANELVTLTASADAIVLKVGRISRGSVAQAGGDADSQEPLFTLVPLTSTLEAEINIATSDIGFIRNGDRVQLKLDAYAFVRHGTAEGVIKRISEGSFTHDETTNTNVAPYFKVIVEIRSAKLLNVPDSFRLIPGMTLQGDIMIGERTIMSYLIDGALRTGAEAMREPT